MQHVGLGNREAIWFLAREAISTQDLNSFTELYTAVCANINNFLSLRLRDQIIPLRSTPLETIRPLSKSEHHINKTGGNTEWIVVLF